MERKLTSKAGENKFHSLISQRLFLLSIDSREVETKRKGKKSTPYLIDSGQHSVTMKTNCQGNSLPALVSGFKALP